MKNATPCLLGIETIIGRLFFEILFLFTSDVTLLTHLRVQCQQMNESDWNASFRTINGFLLVHPATLPKYFSLKSFSNVCSEMQEREKRGKSLPSIYFPKSIQVCVQAKQSSPGVLLPSNTLHLLLGSDRICIPSSVFWVYLRVISQLDLVWNDCTERCPDNMHKSHQVIPSDMKEQWSYSKLIYKATKQIQTRQRGKHSFSLPQKGQSLHCSLVIQGISFPLLWHMLSQGTYAGRYRDNCSRPADLFLKNGIQHSCLADYQYTVTVPDLYATLERRISKDYFSLTLYGESSQGKSPQPLATEAFNRTQ